MHVGSPQRWEYVVWGELYAEIVRSVQCHARPGDVLASQDVLSLAPDAIGLSADAAVPLPILCSCLRQSTRRLLAWTSTKSTSAPIRSHGLLSAMAWIKSSIRKRVRRSYHMLRAPSVRSSLKAVYRRHATTEAR